MNHNILYKEKGDSHPSPTRVAYGTFGYFMSDVIKNCTQIQFINDTNMAYVIMK